MKILSQLSGGLDSVGVLVKLLKEGNEVKCLFFNYNQKYLKQEQRSLKYVDSFFKDYKGYLGYEEIKVPMELTRKSDGSPTDYIPIRNVVFASVSANYALANGFSKIAVGNKTTKVRKDDPWSFSDCSVSFYETMSSTINIAAESGDAIEFIMPLLKTKDEAFTKGDVVKFIKDAGLDFNKLWSCYGDGELPCGECYHCKENKLAFKQAGIEDPLKYS